MKVDLIIDLSLKNTWLYEGCKIHRPPNGGKKLRLDTPKAEASEIVRRNLHAWLRVQGYTALRHGEMVLLMGSTLPWAAMVVRGIVENSFRKVLYQEKPNEKIIEV